MKRNLLDLLQCPHCGGTDLKIEGEGDPVLVGAVTCAGGHRLEIKAGVLHALAAETENIAAQLRNYERERSGDISAEEKESYRRYVARIGNDTYNELIRANAKAALDEMGLPAGGASLDLGGGSGWLALELSRRGFLAVTLDIEDPFVREAQVAAGEHVRDFELVTDRVDGLTPNDVEAVVADMDRLPFRKGVFDLVTTSAALHHSENPTITLRQAYAALKPGGRLLCINEPVKGWFRDERPILGGRGDEAGEHMYTRRQYLRYIRNAGFTEVKLHFPGWVDERLRRQNWSGVLYYPVLRRMVAAGWSMPFIRSIFRGPLLPAGMDVFGLTLIAEARRAR